MVRVPASRLVRLTAILLPLLALTLAGAAPGDLDTTFNPPTGFVRLDVDPTADDVESYSALIVQSDGKIVIAGEHAGGQVLVRLTSTGGLDGTFGSGGILASPMAIKALVQQPDGKFIAVGTGGAGFNQLIVARYNANGTLDSTFDTDGIASVTFSGQGFDAAVALQGDGKIVVAGDFGGDVALARLESNGAPDGTFGSGGKTALDFGELESVRAVGLQSDGRIVVGGSQRISGGPPNPTNFFVARFTAVGELDNTFGDPSGGFHTGWTTTDFEAEVGLPSGATWSSDILAQLAIQSDDSIVAVGYFEANNGAGDTLLLARYTSGGELDTAFGSGGKVIGPEGFGQAVLLQDDKIIAGGSVYTPTPLFGLARYNSDGTLDSTFGVGGIVTTDLGGSGAGSPQITGLALQSDGKIVAAGMSLGPDLAVARYLPEGSAGDTTPPTIVSAKATPSVLWPPHHQMVPVKITVNASDDSGGPVTCAITQIRSNQPLDAPGPWDGHTAVDYVITGPLTARLRAELSLIMGRRTYTLTVSCEDAAGNAATTTVPVIVTLLPPRFLRF